MITKPQEHDTNRAGKLLLRGAMEALGWVATEVTEDYGVDYNVQVFDQHEKTPTGAWFHVQLKSSESSLYSAAGEFISQSLLVDHARHYSSEIRDPIIVVHADVGRRRLYWYAPQLDSVLIHRLTDCRRESVVVRVPTGQELPSTAVDLLSALDRIYLLLGSRELTISPTAGFAESLKHFPDQDALRRGIQDKNDALKLEKIADLYRQKRFCDARPRANALLNDPDSSIEVKFRAEVQLEALDFTETLHSGSPQSELPKVHLVHSLALRKMTHSGPRHLKFYSIIAVKAAQLYVLAHENSGLLMTLRQHLESKGAPMMVIDVYARRAANTKLLIRKYNQCVRLARYAANYTGRWVLPRALTRVVTAVGGYMSSLRWERNFDAERALAISAMQICKLAVWIANETRDGDGIVSSIISALLTVDTEDSDAYRWALETANSITNAALKKDALATIDRAARRWNGEKLEGDYQGNVYIQIAQNIAASVGLDPKDKNNPIIQGLMVAARDSNPERVLAKCEHLLVSQGAIGPVARQIQFLFSLGTAGSKVVHCTLHDYHQQGRELDLAYDAFRKLYCDACPDSKPRPTGWRYTDEVRKELEKRNYEFVARLAGTEHGIRFVSED